MPNNAITKRGSTRVFSIQWRSGPTRTPLYHGWAMAGALSLPLGDVTRIEAPSDFEYNAFDVQDETRGAQENTTLPITLIYPREASEVLKIALSRCAIDVQVHIGACNDPRDFNGGWANGKVLVFENAYITTYGTTELGALESGDEGKVDEEIEISSRLYYEVLPMSYTELAAGEVGQEIIAISVCDSPSCGSCDTPSDGCQKVFAISAPAGSSPGVLAEVVATGDGFTTVVESAISTLSIAEDPDDAECVGDNLVVVSEDSASLHWADKDEILSGSETWAEVTSGFVAGGEPRAISSISPRDTWIVGAGGYVYFTTDPTNSVAVQDAGASTTEPLNDVYAYSTNDVVAVGDNNAVIFTTNGSSWSLVVGPSVGVNLLSVFMRSESEWWVGDADGKLWYTLDSGTNWTEKAFPGSGTGDVLDIVFATDSVGYMAHYTGSAGRILRTISGGNSWYVVPETALTVPTNTQINSLDVCIKEANVVYAGGLSAGGADGIIIKGS